MLVRNISDINGPATDTSSCGMETRVVVYGLEHVPIWQKIQMLGEKSIVRIVPHMPWVTGRNFWEEVIGIANQDWR